VAPGNGANPPDERGGAVDWDALRRAADAAAACAYAPYSKLHVGAAGLCADGHVVSGCNVENASFGLTLCAECGLVSALVGSGRGAIGLVAVSVTAGDGKPLAPCGRCRQLLMEHGGPELLLDGGPATAPRTLGELLPGAFDSKELAARRREQVERPAPGARTGLQGPRP
jgi:cytidine deaminase